MPDSMPDFSHLDDEGRARMVDVGDKPVSRRTARASCRVLMQSETIEKIRQHQVKKGEVLQLARVAGIMAAKQTPTLIPLCHTLALDLAEIDFEFSGEDTIVVRATAIATGPTGVEMEALSAVTVAALTIYDMCKAIDRGMSINAIQLDEKSGGTSGHFRRQQATKENLQK